MAFTVQQDTPVAGANSYVAVADFKAYHADRGNTYTAEDTAIEQALVKATDYLDTRFRFIGYRSDKTQTTEWPRENAWDDRGDAVDGVPQAVKDATSEYALRALTADLLADPDRDASGRDVASKSEAVGPLKESVEYAHGGQVFSLPDYPSADRLLFARKLVHRKSQGVGGGQVGRG